MDLLWCTSGGGRKKTGFDIREATGGGSDGSRSRDLRDKAMLEDEGLGVSDERIWKLRVGGKDTSRPTDMVFRRGGASREVSRVNMAIDESRP